MVQVKTAASLFLAAAAVAPAVAYPYYDADDSLVTREDNEFAGGIYGRRFTPHRLSERDDFEELMEREEFEDLMERDPLLGFNHLKKWIKGRKGAAAPAPDAGAEYARELEFDEDLFTREFDELMEREPILGFNHLRKWLGKKKTAPAAEGNFESPPLVGRESTNEVVFAREVDELEAREPGFLTWIKGIFNPKKKAEEEKKKKEAEAAKKAAAEPAAPEARDYDELLERYFDDLQERELSTSEEELMAREPFLGINHLRKWIKGRKGAAADPSAEAPVAREYDELLEREFYDDLD
ncbi:unnamed protein product [Cyclocybe aegerita]|uniref:Uncharacterized protein n=1 Tax=Cyclocybe aegerita TaxID=1973307 RepID=A0A8S0XTK0_CYCAE|nr:unnamed protein product [Cyclocybe aegerita]